MVKIFLTIALAVVTLNQQKSTNIEGKWIVDNVDVGSMKQKATPQELAALNNFFIKPMTKAVFDFKADHHFTLTPGLPNMPKNDSWEYGDVNKLITVKEYNESKSTVMKIGVLEKDGVIFFTMLESPIVLKVHKL